MLSALLDELADHHLVQLPRGRDGWDNAQPPLPRWLRLPSPTSTPKPTTTRTTAAIVWRRELSWATAENLTPSQIEVLKLINRWLRDTDGDSERRSIVPMRERSLEIFGDEKRLDSLIATTLFAPGRLRLDTLHTERIPPPLAYERLGGGNTLLVIENSDTFETITTLLEANPGNIGYVAFGGGHAFEASAARVARLTGVRDIAYYGDLDDDGLTIPQRANATTLASGLPPIRPAHGLYRLLLQHSDQRPAPKPVDQLDAERRVAWLPSTLRPQAANVLISGTRLPQEATGMALLRRDNSWRDDL
ncbi:Wadjet anti-phage system protein JetD domain-containing protein [Saccharomonospora sp. CUA-673]|uniref:Wadjet anti-phage system protein JetD domain-containing protein n=1 Tax=Saccharomonospora sp. CUA-673 TaxID=1904969 RepID=UPI000AE9FE6F|nr:Wadjet anti-phage system protein JetD domain-containing protein [Saccharomonospora sp. CUA-673]